jgi:spermidine synthase
VSKAVIMSPPAASWHSVVRSRPARQLLLISFVSLYLELTLIRWAPMQVRLLAYFSNYVLIAALLGLGLGLMLASGPRRLVLVFAPALLIVVVAVLVLERSNFVIPIVSEGQFVWNYLTGLRAAGLVSYLILVGFFLSVAGLFMLIGQEVGRAMKPFASLAAYSLNILGSLLGVIGFAIMSVLETPPAVWFGVGGVAVAAYLWSVKITRRAILVSVACIAGTTAVVAAESMSGAERIWSPYYEIETRPMVEAGRHIGYEVAVNKDSHQQALDLSGRTLQGEFIEGRQRLYNLPYQFVEPDRVLVVGAGTGNDVAASLRNAPSASVDAVEIDPVIARLGTSLHPEQPYENGHVRVVIDDARSFLHKGDKRYDLIVFGFLDSHRLFSHMSSVRMDNYVYTRENFARVRDRLAPDGVVAVTFTVHEKWIADRIFTVMTEVFEREPIVYQGDHNAWGTTFLVGRNGLSAPAGAPMLDKAEATQTLLADRERITWRYSDTEGFVDPSLFSARAELLTDDWPFLYMRSRAIPANYLLALILTIAASLLLVWRTVPAIDVRQPGNWNFFFLGAAFALLETRGITEIALVFGSTWLTNTIVIGAILVMILLANLAVTRWRPPMQWLYAGLFAMLAIDLLIPLQLLLKYDFWAQVLVAGIRVAGPLFFSGIIFARWLARTGNPSSALGANLIGAVIGGMLEYLSLMLGLRLLYLLALGFYAASLIIGLRIGLRPRPIDSAAGVARQRSS